MIQIKQLLELRWLEAIPCPRGSWNNGIKILPAMVPKSRKFDTLSLEKAIEMIMK